MGGVDGRCGWEVRTWEVWMGGEDGWCGWGDVRWA